MDVPQEQSPNDLRRVGREELAIAIKFVVSLVAALIFLPPGGLLWQPGAATTVGGWFVQTLLAFVG